MDYQSAWKFLDDLQFFKIKLGLDSMTAFLDSLGQPQKKLRFVHVAGTNGKGSVSVTLLTILAAAGYKVGLYTSPHLNSVRERFRINDHYISENDFARLATRIRSILDGRQITYFEFTTALALLWFEEQQVDLTILEVGLGGRLDATNVVTPLVGIITNVSMDHEAYLGDTLAEVASEKAGIIKPGVPVVTGVSGDVPLREVEEVCKEKKSPLFLINRDFFVHEAADSRWSYRGIGQEYVINDLFCGMKGGYQRENSGVALAALEILAQKGFPVERDIIRKALPKVSWPGRLEYFSHAGLAKDTAACAETKNCGKTKQYLLDGAHNPDGVKSLKEALEKDFSYKKLILVWASMSDKDYAETLSIIAPAAEHIILTMPESERSASPEQLNAVLPEKNKKNAHLIVSVKEALQRAHEIANPEDLICVAGSLYLIGAARTMLLGELVQ